MGLFSKYSQAEINEMAENFVQGIKTFIDGVCDVGTERSYECFEYALYPYFTYLCQSATEWKEIQSAVINNIYEVASYTKLSTKSKVDQCTCISIFLTSLKDEEKKALKDRKNPIDALLKFTLQFLESKDNWLSINTILAIHVVTNEIIDIFNLEQYKAYKLPIIGNAKIPKGKTYSMRNADSSISTFLWLDSIYYNDDEYLVLQEQTSKRKHVYSYNESTQVVSELSQSSMKYWEILTYYART